MPLKLIGDSITQFVLTSFNKEVIIASQDKTWEINDISLGMINPTKQTMSKNLAEKLLLLTNNPLKAFKIVEGFNTSDSENIVFDKKVIEFVFENGDDVMNTISKYLSESKVDVLFVDNDKGKKDRRIGLSFLSNIGKFNVPFIMTNQLNYI